MHEKLPVLFEGHAPFALHEAFDAALSQFEAWNPGEVEPTVKLAGNDLPVSAVFGRMRTCDDLLPARLMDDFEAITGEKLAHGDAATFAQAARFLRLLCVDKLKAQTPGAPTLSAATINAARLQRSGFEQ